MTTTRFGYASPQHAAADVNAEVGRQLAAYLHERDGGYDQPAPPGPTAPAPEPPPLVIDLQSAQVPAWSQGRWERVPLAEWDPLEILWDGTRARLSNGNGRVALARRTGVDSLPAVVTAAGGATFVRQCRV